MSTPSVKSQKKTKSYDLTSGPILNKLLLVALPIMGTQVIQMAYNLTDMFWLGRVSSDAVAASGTVGMYMWLSMAFVMIGRLGAEIGVSQNIGRGNLEDARSFSQTAFTLSFLVGLGFALIMFVFRGPLVGFMNIQEANVAADAVTYLTIVCVGMPFSFLTASITGTFNGSGNSRTPFIINCIGLGTNMLLDPLLILTFGYGIAGAAIATIAAQILACALSVLALLYTRGRPFEKYRIFAPLIFARLKQILKWTIPVVVESFLFTFLSMLISRLVAGWGAGALAAQKVGSQIESLSWLIAGGFSTAMASFIGQNYGAQKWGRIHSGVKLGTLAMAIWGAVITVVLFFGGGFIVSIFLPGDQAAMEIGSTYLKILAVCQIVACLEGVAMGAFRGMGKTLPPSVISITSNSLRVIAAYVLSSTSLGLNGVWWAITIGAFVRGLWMYIWYMVSARKSPKEDVLVNNF